MTLQERFISRLLWNWGAPAVQTVTAIAMLPVITAVLGPAEIGAFAVVMSAAALIAAVSAMGSTYLLSAHYPSAEPAERRALVSTMICVSVAIAALATGVPRSAVGCALSRRSETPPAQTAQTGVEI